MSNEFVPQTPSSFSAAERAAEPPTSQTSAPELGGADVELKPDKVGQTIPEPFSTLPPMVETSEKPSDGRNEYLLDAALRAMQNTEIALGN